MDETWFKSILAANVGNSQQRPRGSTITTVGTEAPSQVSLLAFQSAVGTQQVAQSLVPPPDFDAGAVSSSLAKLTVADVQRMSAVGMRPVVYRSPMTGQMTYRMKGTAEAPRTYRNTIPQRPFAQYP